MNYTEFELEIPYWAKFKKACCHRIHVFRYPHYRVAFLDKKGFADIVYIVHDIDGRLFSYPMNDPDKDYLGKNVIAALENYRIKHPESS